MTADLTELLNRFDAFPTYDAYAAADPVQRDALSAAEDALIRAALDDADPAGDAIVPHLIGWLRDPAWGRRQAAIYCLGEIRDPRAVQPLIEAFGPAAADNPIAVVDLAAALHSIGAISVRPLIYALTHQPDPAVRRGAVFALEAFRDPLAADALIAALTGDEDATVRTAAASALGAARDARAVQPLIDVLTGSARDPDPAVREAAARALGTIGAVLSTPALLAALTTALTDPDWGTAQSAAEMRLTLAADADGAALTLLTRDLTHADAERRLGAAASLLPVKPPAAVDALVRLLYHADAAIVGWAARLLGEYRDRRAIPALENLLTHADSAVRHAAAAAKDQIMG